MRSFITASLILSSVIVAIACNSVIAIDKIETLLEICDEFGADASAETADKLFDEWNECKDFLSLSIHYNEIQEAEFAVIAIRRHKEDIEARDVQLENLRDTLIHIADSQRFSLTSIF